MSRTQGSDNRLAIVGHGDDPVLTDADPPEPRGTDKPTPPDRPRVLRSASTATMILSTAGLSRFISS
ncbi:hypothetical protein [Nocardiopsis chromatogenes]|uniref:hypothetical protein n=1 Tax=Nocardiopsis chromatogenes TaxID=280239 RepID=UPI001268A5DB|nr:hypothetical protein [Nocardiopsis chromatogenes]